MTTLPIQMYKYTLNWTDLHVFGKDKGLSLQHETNKYPYVENA